MNGKIIWNTCASNNFSAIYPTTGSVRHSKILSCREAVIWSIEPKVTGWHGCEMFSSFRHFILLSILRHIYGTSCMFQTKQSTDCVILLVALAILSRPITIHRVVLKRSRTTQRCALQQSVMWSTQKLHIVWNPYNITSVLCAYKPLNLAADAFSFSLRRQKFIAFRKFSQSNVYLAACAIHQIINRLRLGHSIPPDALPLVLVANFRWGWSIYWWNIRIYCRRRRSFHIYSQVRSVGAHPLYRAFNRRGLLDPVKLAYDPRYWKAGY